MSDRKPFAVALPAGVTVSGGSGRNVSGISIDGGAPWRGPERYVDAQNLVIVINAVVEQREANLLGAAAELAMRRHDWFFTRDHGAQFAADLLKLHPSEDMWVPGHVACGLAFDLGAAQWTQLVLQRAAEGLADARGIEVRPFLAAVTGNRPPMEVFSDDELRAEIERRIGPVRDPRKAVEEMIRRFGVHLDEWQRRILDRLADPPILVPASGPPIPLEPGQLLHVGTPRGMTATEVRLRDEARQAERERATELLAMEGEWAHMCSVRDVLVLTPLPQPCMHCRQMPPLMALRAARPRT